MICSILRSPVLRSLQYMSTFHPKSGDIYVGVVCVHLCVISQARFSLYLSWSVIRYRGLLVTPVFNP